MIEPVIRWIFPDCCCPSNDDGEAKNTVGILMIKLYFGLYM